jgi:succinate dehydrogenase/fumarate reductase flavoprotein subunit
MAAIEAHDAGADVIILEKMAEGFEGGSMGCCGGLVGVKGLLGTPSLVGFTQDDVRALTWGEADSVTIQKYLDGLDELQDWFDSIGLVTNIIDGPPYGKSARIQPEPGWLNGGHTWFMAVKSQVTQRGIRVMYETPGKKLIQDPVTKEILGVIAEKYGQQIAVKAKKGVILATGTYVSNPKMVHDWIGRGVDIA